VSLADTDSASQPPLAATSSPCLGLASSQHYQAEGRALASHLVFVTTEDPEDRKSLLSQHHNSGKGKVAL
jgi:hypothetical protein